MQLQIQLWYHAVWGTKHREAILQAEHFKVIRSICDERAAEWQFDLDTVNGTEDHAHILIQLHPSQPVAKVIGWIKGATSHAFGEEFAWHSGYLVQTVSVADLDQFRSYIREQVVRHQTGRVNPNWELPDV